MEALADYLFRAERRGDVRFLLIGGRSLEAYGYVRNTKDIDFLIASSDTPAMSALLAKVGYVKDVETTLFSRWRHRSLGAEDVDLMYVEADVFEKLAVEAMPFVIGHSTLRVPALPSLVALKLHAMSQNEARLEKDGGDIRELSRRHPQVLTPEVLARLCAQFGTPEIAAWLLKS
jgi:hypothetical protein